MNFIQTKFIKSSASLSQCPADSGREIAFIGRSNAGKSSTINALCHNKKLARISKTPGRTQLLNFFHIDENLRLVDLPGLGYAKVPQSQQKIWTQLINQYLNYRYSLKGVVLISDARYPNNVYDESVINFALDRNIKMLWLLNKSDKLKQSEKSLSIKFASNKVKSSNNINYLLFSAKTKHNLPIVVQAIHNLFQNY